MRFRQVHLDFHTSEAIANIGANFSKKQFQDMLRAGHVDSITVFSKCHHGWAYHPSTANEIHPHLNFDLLGAMIEAAHEIDVKTPVYISAGLDEKLVRRHPEWLIRNIDGNPSRSMNLPGYHQFCLASPYLDVLIAQVEEVVRNYDADGIFLDIVGVRKSYSHYCVNRALEQGIDPVDEDAMLPIWEDVYANYTRRVEEAAHAIKPDMKIFHNGGHIRCGRRDLARMNSHLELESLPTGGWGYDHFPLSARYVQQLGMDVLGMTGKFHTTWGEFGGYKHPNALRYETSLSIANGARCSIGDQLHPEGLMDQATYELIGAAYSEVETKEAWCVGTKNIADVALLSLEAAGTLPGGAKNTRSDAGACRMLLEGNILFDVVDLESDIAPYKVVILPDYVTLDAALQSKLEQYVQQGGKLLASGTSGLHRDKPGFALDFGAKWLQPNPFQPDYFNPHFKPGQLGQAAFVFYGQGQRIELDGGEELGHREDPYFNRAVYTFCSHQHTPGSGNNGGPGMVLGKSGIYIAWTIFEDYAQKGSLISKETVLHALKRLLPEPTLTTNLPAQGVVTLQEQTESNRLVNHLLYASPVRRGEKTEVIEDMIPLHNIRVSIRTDRAIGKAYLAPQMTEIPFEQAEGRVSYTVPVLECHQMVVLES